LTGTAAVTAELTAVVAVTRAVTRDAAVSSGVDAAASSWLVRFATAAGVTISAIAC